MILIVRNFSLKKNLVKASLVLCFLLCSLVFPVKGDQEDPDFIQILVSSFFQGMLKSYIRTPSYRLDETDKIYESMLQELLKLEDPPVVYSIDILSTSDLYLNNKPDHDQRN